MILEFTACEMLTHPAGAPSPARIAARRPLLPEDLCNGQVNIHYLPFVFALMIAEANADSSTLDAAIGGGTGGAAGAAIGNEVGGCDGAIVGGALGGALGAAANTKDEPGHTGPHKKINYKGS